MVRLKVLMIWVCGWVLPCFNSKMVRLKDVLEDDRKLLLARFQFQDGSIKRLPLPECSDFVSLFQFQDGSIKSHLIEFETDCIEVFQFQDGSIKRNQSHQIYNYFHVFQFQDGSIKRPHKVTRW